MASETGVRYAVQMNGIYKYYGDFCALSDVSLKVEQGSIHALLGENGAGKSTLMNVLYGMQQAQAGEIYINGEKKDIRSPSAAIENGIGMVHQHFMLVEPFTVTENIMLGMESTNAVGVIDTHKVREKVLELSHRYNLSVDPDAKIEDISVGMQQRVEILKALYRGAQILILDEPTAVLTPQEITELINIMENLTKDDKTIIIITHKLREIKRSSQKCTIIRRGKYIDTVDVDQVSESDLASMMVGRDVSLKVEKKPANPGETVFSIEGLTVADARNIDRVRNLSINVRKGEIVGIAGIDGNGQKELVEAITGLRQSKSGTICINGKQVQNKSPREVISSGISTVHEDRHRRGLIMDFTVAENAIIERYGEERFSKKGILLRDSIKNFACELIERFDIRPAGCENNFAKELSGGNQQKVVLAREITSSPDILIAVQPTRGLDVGAIEFVHRAIIEQRDAGMAVLLISLDLNEIMDVSDRIAVLYEGSIVAEMPAQGASEEEIGLYMAGGGTQ